MISPYDRLTRALEDHGSSLREQENRWQCPVRGGHALKVDDAGDGTALVTCFHPCDTEDVVKAVGLTMADLSWPRDEAEQPGPVPAWVAEHTPYGARSYRYTDEMGSLLFTVHRGADKSFRQQAADGSPKLDGVRRVLFNLPRVLSAIERGETVHVTEGEKDVHALTLSGLSATCNPMGAGKWREEYTASLKGAREVVVWQDKDEPGRKHAQALCASLEAVSIPHRLVEARTGKDPWDHLAAGWSAEQAVSVALPGSVAVNNWAEAADWLRAELGRNKLACLFRRDGLIVHTPRVGEDGYLPPSDDEAGRGVHPGPAQVRPVSTSKVKALVEVRYNVVRKSGKDATPALFPAQAAASAVDGAEMGEGTPNLRELHGTTHTPVIRADGSVLSAPGYDDATGLLYLPDKGLTVPEVPSRPTEAQIKDAVDLILRPVAQFPFVSENHRANWVGLMLTPMLRELLPPPYQFGVVTATNPGSGKTLLTELISTVHGGTLRGELPTEAEEQRKTITSVLVDTTAPVVVFDNLTGVVRSSVLESLLTSSTYSDRWLGHSKNLTLTNDRLWLATGNNCKIGGDLARRCVFVAIDPRQADPHKRTGFDIPNLSVWMSEHRGAYLAALLTVVRGWVLAGSPGMADLDRSDSFAKWSGSLRAILHWAGVPGTFGAEDDADVQHGSEDDIEWGAFLSELYRVFGPKPVTARDILARVSVAAQDTGGIDPAKLPGDLTDRWERAGASGRTAGVVKSLGKWLGNREGRYADGYVVTAYRSGKHAVRYAVVAPDPGGGLGFTGESSRSPAENKEDQVLRPIKGSKTPSNPKPPSSESQTPGYVTNVHSGSGSDTVQGVPDCLPQCGPDPFDPFAQKAHAHGCPNATRAA